MTIKENERRIFTFTDRYLTTTNTNVPLPIREPTGYLRFVIRDGKSILQQEWGLKVRCIGGYEFPSRGEWDDDGKGGWKLVPDNKWASHYEWEDVPTTEIKI